MILTIAQLAEELDYSHGSLRAKLCYPAFNKFNMTTRTNGQQFEVNKEFCDVLMSRMTSKKHIALVKHYQSKLGK